MTEARRVMDEGSWAGLLQSHFRRRTELSWKPEEQEPVKYVTRYEVSRKEREFDPVLQCYRVQDRENQFRETEDRMRTHALNRSKINNLTKTQSHDVVNHQPSFPGVAALNEREDEETALSQQTQQAEMQRRGHTYNIINNVDSLIHKHSSPSLIPANTDELGGSVGSRAVTTEEKQAYARKRSSHPDIDMISNRYKQQHNVKVKADEYAFKKAALDKYWQSHDFDPVFCRFYQPDKEQRFQHRLSEMNRVHGQDFNQRLPPGILRSEGTNFNIISMKPKAGGETVLEKQQRQHAGIVARNPEISSSIKERTERAQQEHAALNYALGETRNFNRHTALRHRHMHGYEHGFDIVSTKSYVGRKGVSKPNLRVREGKSLWEQLEQQELPPQNNQEDT